MANTPTSFTCADGSRTLPIQAVNDDYCDCKDGSDEPRTAACANGRFVCMGLTGKTVEIPSSRVNDGVCDSQCCDGSDEFSGLISCPVTCPHLVPGSARSSSIDDRQVRAYSTS
ncbi:glucosidase II beta subunit-like-domain-containing protein [Chytriomyces cf. hyalinus JEL632]|nr:glucosidase II beta subunit-like-domain-containing protein [Chytriomyces cf. hyalinus JEL632]